MQLDFGGGPIHNEKDSSFFLACIDRFSKFKTAELFDRANGQNVLKFLQVYVILHYIPRAIRVDHEKCQIGQQMKAFCNQNNIQFTEAPIHDHRANGLVERLIKTLKSCLVFIKTTVRNNFNLKASIKSIIYQIRNCRQKTINLSSFEAHIGHKANTPLSNFSPEPNPIT